MKKMWHDEAWKEYLNWLNQDKKTLSRKKIGIVFLFYSSLRFPVSFLYGIYRSPAVTRGRKYPRYELIPWFETSRLYRPWKVTDRDSDPITLAKVNTLKKRAEHSPRTSNRKYLL